MKLKRFLSIGLCLAMLAALLTVPALAADNTLALREDWRLTSNLDLNVPEGTTLTIKGNGFHIYEMGGKLLNSGLGTVTFEDGTILYPAANDTDAAKVIPTGSWDTGNSNALMLVRQGIYTVTIDSGITNGSVTASPATAKVDDTVTLTVTPDSGYELDTLTVKDANDGNLSVTNKTFVMPASNVTVTATFKQSNTPSETTYAVTVHGSYADPTGAGSYAEGASVAISAGSRSGYTFAGWTSSDVTISDASNANASFTMPAKVVTVTANWTQNSTPGDSGSSSSGSSFGGSSSSSSTTTKNPDGSTTTTTTDKTTGTVTETTKTADGTTGTVVTDKSGEITEVKSTVSTTAASAAEKSGEAVTLPVEVPSATSTSAAPAVEVTIPKNVDSVKIEIPVETVTPGTVAVIIRADGTEEIVKTSVLTEDGVTLTLEASATVKIIDNSKAFTDVHSVNHWAQDSIDFVTSRELFTGKTEASFDPNAPTTRAQLMTVLARLDNADTSAAPLQQGMNWAVENGISDGSNPSGAITRQQLAAMLWRYAGSPATNHELTQPDADKVSNYAVDAMRWAVENGIINGKTDGTLDPNGLATRAQVATMVARYCATLA